MNCPQPQQLQQLLDDALPADELQTIHAHLETCELCQKTLERLAAGGVTWDKTAQNLKERPKRDETRLVDAVHKLQSGLASDMQTEVGSASAPFDEDLSFLQPSQKPGSIGRLDKYEVLSVIGKGGFGIVLKAFDDTLHRVVAVKIMSPAIASNGAARQRFDREAKAAAAVTHENVVHIYEVRGDVKIPYLVMQFVSGTTLGEKLDKHGALSVKEILRIGLQTAEGLAAAHKQGLIHRDIKPGNILLENGIERVKITDFGLARSVDDASVTQSGTIAGTPMFMSPEQANGEPVDVRSDLFSLGSVLYVMATGRAPFRASSTMAVLKRVCEDTPTPIRQINPDIPEWLGDLIGKLHAKKPADRFQKATEVAERLSAMLAEVQAGRTPSVRAPSEPAQPQAAHPRGSRGALAWLSGGVAVALIIFIAMAIANKWGPSAAKGGATVILGGPIDDLGLEKVVIKSIDIVDGEARSNGLHNAELTQEQGFVKPRKASQVTLPPGKYEIEVICRPGYEVRKCDVSREDQPGLSLFTEGVKAVLVDLEAGEQRLIQLVIERRPPIKSPADEPGWVQLFNGKDETGFHTAQPETWKVKDGVLIGAGKGFLNTTRRFGNFHCKLEAKINAVGSASFGFRSTSNENGSVRLGNTIPNDRTGTLRYFSKSMLLKEVVAVQEKELVPPDTWFTLDVIAKGHRVVVLINGVKATEGTMDALADAGQLHLYAIVPETVLQVRKFEIKELPSKEPGDGKLEKKGDSP